MTDKPQEVLLSCPFCKSTDIRIADTTEVYTEDCYYMKYQVYCNNCKAKTDGSSNKSIAITKWNNREGNP